MAEGGNSEMARRGYYAWNEGDVEAMEELDGERILVRVRFQARGRGGIEVERVFYNLLTFRGGLVAQFRV